MQKPVVMTIAGHDPSGGAGIQADIETLAALDCHAVSVITALTVQDSCKVKSYSPVPIATVLQQATTVLQDMPVQVFKLGMLASTALLAPLARLLNDYPDIPLVLDPVLASGSGDTLADDSFSSGLLQLLSRVTVLTPNSEEARTLAGEETPEACAENLLQAGCRHVLLTGTHLDTDSVINRHCYLENGKMRCVQRSWPRLPGSYHGSGCTLAAAVAAGIAHGSSIDTAIDDAQHFTWQSLYNAFAAGQCQEFPDRFYTTD
jgi:hydroxymethylpyrimidine/phosphomethylpyrimidine kinase